MSTLQYIAEETIIYHFVLDKRYADLLSATAEDNYRKRFKITAKESYDNSKQFSSN